MKLRPACRKHGKDTGREEMGGGGEEEGGGERDQRRVIRVVILIFTEREIKRARARERDMQQREIKVGFNWNLHA